MTWDWFWVLVALSFLAAVNTFLMWATHDQGRTIRGQRRELRRLRGQAAEPDSIDVLAIALDRTPVEDPETGATWLLPRQRTAGDQS